MKSFMLRLLSSALLVSLAQPGQAALNAVDPGPYTAATGFFPQWYQDTEAVALDFCLSKAESSRVPGAGAPSYMCTLLPNPPIFDDTLPIVWGTNFPDESFWFTADAGIDNTPVADPQGIVLGYGSAIEAAFGGGVPAENDQITFARIRIRADVSLPGSYRVTHPYGVEDFIVTAADCFPSPQKLDCLGAINLTRDVGIGTPGDFTGALAGDIGPFLRSANPDAPYVETNPDTGLPETFIGDPNLFEPVTGSPFGTNYVRVEAFADTAMNAPLDLGWPEGICVAGVTGTACTADADCNTTPPPAPPDGDCALNTIKTDVFAVSGKIFEATLPTPLTVDRTSYSNSLLGTFSFFETDVFALAPSTATLSFTDIASSTTPMDDLDANSVFYGYDNTTLGVPLSTIDVNAMNPPGNLDTTTPGTLVDLVTIRSATYSLGTGELNVVAASSDEINPPLLTLAGTSLLPGAGAAGVLFTIPAGQLSIPPATVTVISANGGSDTEAVVLIP